MVVGGGVVGCAVLRELTVHLGWRVLLVEASPHLAAGASSGNTGIACTASDVAPGTLEHACLLEGTRLNLPTYRALNVPHRASGAMYVGHSAANLAALTREQAARQRRGDTTTAMLGAGDLALALTLTLTLALALILTLTRRAATRWSRCTPGRGTRRTAAPTGASTRGAAARWARVRCARCG